MPVEGPLPQTGDEQDIGADAESCFAARKPKGWREHKLGGTDDYGLDFQVQTTVDQQVTDVFRVQLKGTKSPSLSADESFISIQLKATTVRFYDRIVEPILLVLCDLSVNPDPVDCPLYYAWVREELRRIEVEKLGPEQQYVTLRVPTNNRLTRSTDLSADVNRQNELARAGQALDVHVERVRPGMRVEERLAVVHGITAGVVSRGATFIDALSAPTEQHWIDPGRGTLAWHLKEADRLLRVGLEDRATRELNAMEAGLVNSTPLEHAEYWFLRGKSYTASGGDHEASDAFKKAHDVSQLGRHLAGWAEAQIRLRYDTQTSPDYSDLLAELSGNDPAVLLIKSRLLAAQDHFDEALAVADDLPIVEHYTARAFVHTMSRNHAGALKDCEHGLALSDLPEGTRQVLLLLRARAKFSLALASVPHDSGELLPPSGAIGIDPILVKDAWEAVQKAAHALQEAGWGTNLDHFADVWAATASMLGKQREVLPLLAAAANARPHLKNVQIALEAIAAQCGEFNTALEANDRLPASEMRELRRTLLLHEADKHSACFRHFNQQFDSMSRTHPLFGQATTVAAISAHRLSEPELVKKWSSELEAHPHLHEHAALLQYHLETEINKIDNEEALSRLIQRYRDLEEPSSLAVGLLQVLNPAKEKQAALCIEVADRIQRDVELGAAMSLHVALALVTIKNWSSLLVVCQRYKTRLDASPRMIAFEALSLDQLGRTAEARQLLEQMLAGGVLDSWALNTYVTIMVRCGYVREALAAAEQILEAASNNRRKIECTRLLFNLIQNSDPTSSRLLALALQMGRLADQTSEIEEGIYLVMFLMATLSKDCSPGQEDAAQFQQRADVFFERFPNSNIIWRGQLRDNATPEDFLAQLKAVAGITEEREAFQRRLANQLQQGLVLIPFSWRPKRVLTIAQDVVHLWEIAKRSSPDDRKYHLVMEADNQWIPQAASTVRSETPLLDLTTLLVLFDLDLMDAVIGFFGRISIAKATLETLADLTSPFSGSPYFAKCVAIQNALKPHLMVIDQPSSSRSHEDDDKGLGREYEEIMSLCAQEHRYRLYSDDLVLRTFCGAKGASKGISTLEVLCGLEEVELLTREQVATRVASLCAWHVGVVVRFEDLIGLIPSELDVARNVREGIQIIDGRPSLTAMISAVWDFRAPFSKTLEHVTAVVRRLIDETELPTMAVAALLGEWFIKMGVKKDAPSLPLRILTIAIVIAASKEHLSQVSARKLWAIFLALVEFHHGEQMDEGKEREAIHLLGVECAELQAKSMGSGESAAAALQHGLTEGTSDEARFSSSYSGALLALRAQAARSRA